jgi:VanZ family protein
MLIALIVIAWIILAFVWIPARTGFHFRRPDCNLQLTIDFALFAATKYKHIFLFGMFYLMTRVQLGRTRYAIPIAAAATIAVGMLIEIEETLTRTGTCNLRDLVPDAIGALIGEVIWRIWRRQ